MLERREIGDAPELLNVEVLLHTTMVMAEEAMATHLVMANESGKYFGGCMAVLIWRSEIVCLIAITNDMEQDVVGSVYQK